MIRFLICDSNKEVRERLRRCVERHFSDICSIHIEELDMMKWDSAAPSANMRCDVLLLRIEDNKADLGLAKYALAENSEYQLIAYSQKSETIYVPELFELNLVYFLQLDQTEELLPKALEIVQRNLRVMERQYLVCNSRYQKVKIFFENVIYVEHNNHVSVVHTKDGSYHIRRSLNELEIEFAVYPSLLRCHVSYIVNLTYVVAANRQTFQLKDGRMIPVSRGYSGNVRKVLAERDGDRKIISGKVKERKNAAENIR